KSGRAAEEADTEVQRPAHRLGRPRRDAVRYIKEVRGTIPGFERPSAPTDQTLVCRQQARDALEQRGLARSVRADEAHYLARTDEERYVVQRDKPSKGFRQAGDVKLSVCGRMAVSHRGRKARPLYGRLKGTTRSRTSCGNDLGGHFLILAK